MQFPSGRRARSEGYTEKAPIREESRAGAKPLEPLCSN
jgi:hypothetical protein